MKIGKLKHTFLILCCFIFAIAIVPQQEKLAKLQASENKKNENVLKLENQIDIPKGVEISKTLIRDGIIYVVGITASAEAPYNLKGTEQYPKVFVAQYNRDLKVEKVVDTGYIYSFYSAELYHGDENRKTVFKKDELAKSPRFEMYFSSDKLTVVGIVSDPNKSKYGGTADTIIEHHVNMIAVMQYDKTLQQLQKTELKFTNYTYGVEFTSIVTEDFVYVTYIPQQPGRFGREKSGLVQYSFNDFSQKKTGDISDESEREKVPVSYRTMVRYKDGVALERHESALSTDGVNEWDYFSNDLKNNGKIGKGQGIYFKNHFDYNMEKSSRDVNPSFKTNGGTVYRFLRNAVLGSLESHGAIDADQDDKGRIISLNIDKTAKPEIIIHGTRGEITENRLSFNSINKKSTNMSVSSYQDKIIVVIAQKLYLVEINSKSAVEKSGEFNNQCYRDLITGSGESFYYDSKNNSCYVSKVTTVSSESHDVNSYILKDGKEFVDFKTSKFFRGTGVFFAIVSIITDADGNLIVAGTSSYYPSGDADKPYSAIIDSGGKIIKEVQSTVLALKQEESIKTIPKYTDVKMIGKNFVYSGKQENYYMTGEEASHKPYTIPFVQIVDKELKEIKTLLNQNIEKYKNYEVESVETIGQQYLRILLFNKETQTTQKVLYSFKENKVVNTIAASVEKEVISHNKIVSIVDDYIVEKDMSGKEVSKQPLKLENVQITPIKSNNQYIVSSINESNKLQFHLIGTKGEELKTLETEIEISTKQLILYLEEEEQSLEKIRFFVVDADGTGSQFEVDATMLRESTTSQEFLQNPFIIVGVSVVVVIIVMSSVLIVQKRKKGRRRS